MHSRVAPLLMPATAPKWRGAQCQSYQAGGLLYKTNFLTPASYEAVRDECRSLRRHFKRELDSTHRQARLLPGQPLAGPQPDDPNPHPNAHPNP